MTKYSIYPGVRYIRVLCQVGGLFFGHKCDGADERCDDTMHVQPGRSANPRPRRRIVHGFGSYLM